MSGGWRRMSARWPRRPLVSAGIGIVAAALGAAACSSTSTAPSAPAHKVSTAAPSATTVTVRSAPAGALGSILVDSQGKTLYRFSADHRNASTCSGVCAQAWPPLVVPPGTSPTTGSGVKGTLGTLTRADGTVQVTVDGWPLYTFAADTAAGQTKGQ